MLDIPSVFWSAITPVVLQNDFFKRISLAPGALSLMLQNDTIITRRRPHHSSGPNPPTIESSSLSQCGQGARTPTHTSLPACATSRRSRRKNVMGERERERVHRGTRWREREESVGNDNEGLEGGAGTTEKENVPARSSTSCSSLGGCWASRAGHPPPLCSIKQLHPTIRCSSRPPTRITTTSSRFVQYKETIAAPGFLERPPEHNG